MLRRLNVVCKLCFVFIERKLRDSEFPHTIYIRNYSSELPSCLALRKWVFTLPRVRKFEKDLLILFHRETFLEEIEM